MEKKVNPLSYSDIITAQFLEGVIENNEMEGFREDFHILHCLLRIYKPERFLEVGTNLGRGTAIICNAGSEWNIGVSSLDLPQELSYLSKQYPGNERPGSVVGELCKFEYTQLFGDSMKFDYGQLYPIDGWFIDGEHDKDHARHESEAAIESGAKLIVWHDADMEEVYDGIMEAFKTDIDYFLYRVYGTRMMFAVKKEK